MDTILIIDDEDDIRDLLGDIFEDEGYTVLKAAHSEQALAVLNTHPVDLIVLDIWLDNSDMDGVQILKYLKAQKNLQDIPVLMISGHGNVEMAVNTMKMGAFDFIEKPFKIDHILMTVQRTLDQKSLKDENLRLRETDDGSDLHHHYKSPLMMTLIKTMMDQKESDARVLITGEMGTGKTRFAKLIHSSSKRAKYPIRFLEASTLTPERLDNELSHNAKGCIIIENIDRLAKEKQSEILTILSATISTAHLIFTSSPDIDDKVQSGCFSSALYDRIAILRYNIPPLRERMEDVPLLIEGFLSKLRSKLGVSIRNDFKSMDYIQSLVWNGNVKQLKLAVEWMAFCQIGEDEAGASFYDMPLKTAHQTATILNYQRPPSIGDLSQFYELSLKDARETFEYQFLSFMLQKYDGCIAKMARAVDMDRTALHRKLKSMNLTLDPKIQVR